MNKILLIATTKLQKDGLSEIIQRIVITASGWVQVGIALAEGCDEETSQALSAYAKMYHLPSRKESLLLYMASLRKLICKEKYQTVHIHGNSATMAFDLLAAWFGGAKVRITHVHNCAPQPRIKQLTLGSLLNCLVTSPIACSSTSGKMLYRKPFRIITNGADCDRFAFSPEKRMQMRKALDLENAFVVGHIGRFSPQKNQMQLIHIFYELLHLRSNSVLLLCGDGEDLEKCQQEVHRLNIDKHVLFCGKVEHPNDYYQAMDVFVLPSLFEGLPLVGVEAQACGLPCIFSDSITAEVKLLPETLLMPLDASDAEWANAINSIQSPVRETAAAMIKKAGYTVQALEDQIRELYTETE